MTLRKQPNEEMLLALLDTQLRKCKALGPAFSFFDGAQEGSEQRTFKFLDSAAGMGSSSHLRRLLPLPCPRRGRSIIAHARRLLRIHRLLL